MTFPLFFGLIDLFVLLFWILPLLLQLVELAFLLLVPLISFLLRAEEAYFGILVWHYLLLLIPDLLNE
jgi:hypothetical protein